MLLNLFYEAAIYTVTKPEKGIARKLKTNMPYEHIHKTLNKILINQIQQYIKNNFIHQDLLGFILECKDHSVYEESERTTYRMGENMSKSYILKALISKYIKNSYN